MSKINGLCKGCIFLRGTKNTATGLVAMCLIKILPTTVVSICPCLKCLLKPVCNSRCENRVAFFSNLRGDYEKEFKEEFLKQRTMRL